MSVLKRMVARVRAKARATSPRARWALLAATALVVGGGLWLAMDTAAPRPAWAPACEQPMSAADLAAASELAAGRHIPFRTEGGKLMVPPAEVERFRGLLAYEGVLDREKVVRFEELADQNDIWRTEAQKAKRWQAAKMAALSRLIGHFPAVQQATVIFEPGIPRGLGRSPVAPTAAVKVVMGEGQRMTAKLASAIADLVAGSITGMERKDVRIVDNAGRSYRPDADGGNIQEDPVEQLARLDSYYQARIHAALHYIRNVVAGVSVAAEGRSGRCKAASVSLPRSYLAAIYRSANAGADPNDALLEKFAAPRLAKIRRTVADAVSAEDANTVKVDWYYDISAEAAPAVATGPKAGAPSIAAVAGPARSRRADLWADGSPARAAAAAAAAALGLAAALLAATRRRRSPAGTGIGAGAAAGEPARAAQAGESPTAAAAAASPGGQGQAEDPFVELQRNSPEDLHALLQGEHPQTIALILAHVPEETAAAVLGGFSRDRQVEVSRRIAEMSPVARQVVGEVLRGLLSRRAGEGAAGTAAQGGGVGKVAKILHHAGYATEKAVLDGLTGSEPALAESIRKRMFVFEDVSLLPRAVLASALEGLGSDELAIALRTASKEVKEKILAGLSRQAGSKVRQEMDRIGPVRLSDVEAAQERVVEAVRRLEAGRYVSTAPRKGSEVLA